MLTVLLVYPGSALRRQHRRHHPDRRLFGHRLYSSRSRRLLYHQAGRGRRQRQQVVLSYHLFCPFYFIKVRFCHGNGNAPLLASHKIMSLPLHPRACCAASALVFSVLRSHFQWHLSNAAIWD